MDPDDWRRMGQKKYLMGAELEKKKYAPYDPEGDHDHCEFCWATFSETTPDAVKAKCDFLLTTDDIVLKKMLGRSEITVLNPTEFIKVIEEI